MRNKKENELLAEAYGSIYNEGLLDGLKNMARNFRGKMAPEAKPKQPAAAPAQQAAAQEPEQADRQGEPYRAKLDELDKAGQLEILSVQPDQVNSEIAEVAFGGLIFDLTFITKTAEQDVPGIVKGNLKSIEFIDEDNVTPEDEAVKKQLGDLIGSHGFPEYTMNG
jgi:hypothetical protein